MAQEYAGSFSATPQYAYEDADAYQQAVGSHTASNATYVPFGYGVSATPNPSNSSERVYGTGSRNAQANVKLSFVGNLSVNGTLSNAYWLLGVLGANADGGSSGAYTHTYTEANTVPSWTCKYGLDLATDKVRTLVGCVANSCTISASVGETAKFSLEGQYRYETTSSATLTMPSDTEPIFTFAHGVLQMPDGTDLAAVQNIELTIVSTLEMIYGTGSRFAQGYVVKNREYNIRMTLAVKDFTLLSRFYDGTNSSTAPAAGSGTEIATLELTFTNDDGDILDINLTGIELSEHNIPLNPNEMIKEDVTGWARACTNIIYTNDIQTAPTLATNI